LQREFDALLSNDDRQDYIDLIEGVKAVQNHGVISLDELKATHGDVQPV
jgi:hypothetical protein